MGFTLNSLGAFCALISNICREWNKFVCWKQSVPVWLGVFFPFRLQQSIPLITLLSLLGSSSEYHNPGRMHREEETGLKREKRFQHRHSRCISAAFCVYDVLIFHSKGLLDNLYVICMWLNGIRKRLKSKKICEIYLYLFCISYEYQKKINSERKLFSLNAV